MKVSYECIAGHRVTADAEVWPLDCGAKEPDWPIDSLDDGLCHARLRRVFAVLMPSDADDVAETIDRCGGIDVAFEAFGAKGGSA